MAKIFAIKENKPFPNNFLPVIYYPEALKELTEEKDNGDSVKAYLEKNGYSNSWINGILAQHHFHSNTHEVLVCLSGMATVQLGGPDAESYPFHQGDVLLLPAGTAHKKIDASSDFQIVGAYPNGLDYDMQMGNTEEYAAIKERVSKVIQPEMDPVEGNQGPVFEYWQE